MYPIDVGVNDSSFVTDVAVRYLCEELWRAFHLRLSFFVISRGFSHVNCFSLLAQTRQVQSILVHDVT